MQNKLIEILQHKQNEVAALKELVARFPDGEIARVMKGEASLSPRKKFKQALLQNNFINVIAEIKRRSPSKGELAQIADPVNLAQEYVRGGAAAISVLTDSYGFGGSLEDLKNVATALSHTPIPILRKDFLIDPLQIAEAMVYGADCVLLIVAVLGDQLPLMLQETKRQGVDALVEVHTPEEIAQIKGLDIEIIGVNNRNLKTFTIDTQSALDLRPYLPEAAVKVAESGIFEAELAKQYHAIGYNAVLVGEALVQSTTPADWISELHK